MEPLDLAAVVLVWAGAAGCVLAAAGFGFGRMRAASLSLAAGWLACAGLFGLNWWHAAGPPFGNMYHVLVFLALSVPVLYAVLDRFDSIQWAGLYFAITTALALTGAGCMDRDVHWRRMPALQSPWFVPHVFAYVLSYALAATAFVMTVASWCRRDAAVRERNRRAAHRLIRVGFPFMTFGMLSGALWAEEAWGIYWSWDAKEIWSLITWLWYVAYLHCAAQPRWRRWATAAQTLAFAALLWTFFLVNLWPSLSSALHSYAR